MSDVIRSRSDDVRNTTVYVYITDLNPLWMVGIRISVLSALEPGPEVGALTRIAANPLGTALGSVLDDFWRPSPETMW